MKQRIRLTESGLHRIVKESVKRILLKEDACKWAVLDTEGEIVAQFREHDDAFDFYEKNSDFCEEIVPLGRNGYIMPYEGADEEEY